MRRISINPACVADTHANKADEKIAEFYDPVLQKGGLICVRRRDDGTLTVDVYRCDPGVFVNGAEAPR